MYICNGLDMIGGVKTGVDSDGVYCCQFLYSVRQTGFYIKSRILINFSISFDIKWIISYWQNICKGQDNSEVGSNVWNRYWLQLRLYAFAEEESIKGFLNKGVIWYLLSYEMTVSNALRHVSVTYVSTKITIIVIQWFASWWALDNPGNARIWRV